MTHRFVFMAITLALPTGSAIADGAPVVTPSNEAIYNEGVSLYRDSQWNPAAEKFLQASQTDKRDLAAKSRYNLGNCQYAAALDLVSKAGKTDEAMPFIRDAIDSYRSALRIDPSDQDARANLELAVRALDELTKPDEDSKSDQPPEQNPKGDQDDPQNGDNGKEQSQDQKDEQERSESDQSEKSESGDDQNQNSKPDDSAGEQQEQEQKGSDSDDQSNDKQPEASDSSNKPQPQPGQSEESAKPSDEKKTDIASDPSETKNPASEQADSSGKLEANNQQPDELDQAGVREEQQMDTGDGKLMTRQEAMKMLQAIRDRDLLRRYQHERSERSRYVPVERDW